MGLLSWIWDGIRGWVEALIHTVNAWIRPFVEGLISGAKAFAHNLVSGVESVLQNAQKILGDGLKSLRGAWDNFTSKTLPDLWKALGNLRVDFSTGIARSGEDLRKWASDTFGPTKKKVDDLFRDEDFITLTRDPWEFVEIIARRYTDRYMQDAAKSFTEGLQEGLRESEK